MSAISARFTVTPAGGSQIQKDASTEAGAVTTIPIKLDDANKVATIQLGPKGKKLLFLYVSGTMVDAETTATATLSEVGGTKPVKIDLDFPLLLGGGPMALLGNRLELKVERTSAQGTVDVAVLVGREA